MTAPTRAPHWSGVACAAASSAATGSMPRLTSRPVQAPADHPGVEDVPGGAGQHPDAEALAGLDQAHGVQDPDRLADDGAGHPVVLVELVDPEHGARLQLTPDDLATEGVE